MVQALPCGSCQKPSEETFLSALRLAHQGASCVFSIIQSFNCGHVLTFPSPLNTHIAALECHGTLATLVSYLSAIMSTAASWDLVFWGKCEPGANTFAPGSQLWKAIHWVPTPCVVHYSVYSSVTQQIVTCMVENGLVRKSASVLQRVVFAQALKLKSKTASKAKWTAELPVDLPLSPLLWNYMRDFLNSCIVHEH